MIFLERNLGLVDYNVQVGGPGDNDEQDQKGNDVNNNDLGGPTTIETDDDDFDFHGEGLA